VDPFFQFITENELVIYILLGIGGLFALRTLVLGWTEWQKSIFGLEKELAFNKIKSSGVILILLVMIGLSQFCFVSFVIPFFPSTAFEATPTANLLAGTPNAPGTEMTAGPGSQIPAEGTIGCTAGQIMITSPAPDEEISGKLTVKGTINVQNFGYYKYEYSQANDIWVTIAAGDKLILDGELGNWDVTQLTPGDYQLRLMVTDNTGAALPSCSLTVKIRPE
jgi:hypothetical protein